MYAFTVWTRGHRLPACKQKYPKNINWLAKKNVFVVYSKDAGRWESCPDSSASQRCDLA